MPLLARADVDRALGTDLPDWAVTGDGCSITRQLRAPSFLAGIAWVQRVAEAAEDRDHHPDIDIRFRTLTFTLSTHSAGGLPPRTSSWPPRSTGSPPAEVGA